jgi:hypothetical protein
MKWARGFMRNIGLGSNMAAEIRTLHDGLPLAADISINYLEAMKHPASEVAWHAEYLEHRDVPDTSKKCPIHHE